MSGREPTRARTGAAGGARADGRRPAVVPSRAPGRASRAFGLAALVLGLAALDAAAARAQALRGTVLEAGTGRVVALSVLSLETPDGRSVASALADSAGNFFMVAPEAGDYLLVGDRFGYHRTRLGPIALAAGRPVVVEVRLQPAALVMDSLGVYVEAESERLSTVGFYERQRRGVGYFMGPDEVADRAFLGSSEMLASVPGVRLRPMGGGRSRVLLRGGANRDCPPGIWVDAVPIIRRRGSDDFYFEDVVAAGHIEGVEIYRTHAEVPARFSSDLGRCGAIVVWTKQGTGPPRNR